ncbi:MAG: tetratricopeptide repeat protein, partial [Limisphaerales bacterium]
MAVRLKRNSPKVHNNLSVAFYNQGDVAKAIHHSALALQFAPDDPDLVENLTQIRSAHPELEKHSSAGAARQIWMQVAECHYEAGFAHLQERRVAEGIAKWRLTIKLAPAWADPYCNLAALLAAHPDDSVRNPKEALQLAQKAMQLGDSSPRFYDALAAAYASTGRFREAKQVLEEILPTLRVKGPLESVEKLSEHHRLYTQGKPLRQELPLFRISANKA